MKDIEAATAESMTGEAVHPAAWGVFESAPFTPAGKTNK
jgi:hypothetical protein